MEKLRALMFTFEMYILKSWIQNRMIPIIDLPLQIPRKDLEAEMLTVECGLKGTIVFSFKLL